MKIYAPLDYEQCKGRDLILLLIILSFIVEYFPRAEYFIYFIYQIASSQQPQEVGNYYFQCHFTDEETKS